MSAHEQWERQKRREEWHSFLRSVFSCAMVVVCAIVAVAMIVLHVVLFMSRAPY